MTRPSHLRSPVLVLGAGVAGLSVARELAGQGLQVVLLDPRPPGGGASASAVGVLSAPGAARSPWTRLCREGCESWPGLARELLEETGVDVEYRRSGCLHLFDDPPRRPERAARRWSGARAETRWLERDEIEAWIPGYGGRFRAALRLEAEATLSPARLVEALLRSCELRGVEVRAELGQPLRLAATPQGVRVRREPRGGWEGNAAVLAAGAWSGGVASGLPPAAFRVEPVRGQALEIETPPPRCVVHFQGRPGGAAYHLVPRPGGRVWVGSTVEAVGFAEEVTDAACRELLDAARAVLPDLQAGAVRRQWCGLRPKALRRGGPYLGSWPGAGPVWVACGHYRSGLLTAPVSARWIAESLLNGAPLDPAFAVPPAP